MAVVCTGCEVWGVLEFATDQNVKPYILIAGACMATVAPALPEIAKWCRRSGHYAAWLAALGALVVCLTVVVGAAIQRTGTATDTAEAKRAQSKIANAMAIKAEKDAERDYTVAQEAAIRECSVRGARCMDAEAKASDLRGKLAAARATLVTASIEQSDPFAKRLSAIMLGRVSEDQIRLLWPLLIPLGVSLVAATMFSGWVRVDFVAPPRISTPTALPLAHPAVRLKPAVKFGPISAFLVSATEPAPEKSIAIEAAMYPAYRKWCGTVGVTPYDPNRFARELAGVGKAAGLTIEIRGKEAYCMDRELAA